METFTSQNSSLVETVGVNDECLFWPSSPNERMIQENIKKTPKATQTTLMPSFSSSKIPRSNSESNKNVHVESKNDSVVNASFYESFSIDESKYDSFDDSLDEEAHVSSKKINVSNFLSEQVNVTVRKVREQQKIKGTYLCDSLEDICSLVSNAEHISTSDEIENINNMLEKHGICEDSLRNDICHETRNASLNEYFDDDSLAILEVEKPFDDSLEDVDVASCVDSLMILGNSIGDTDVMVDKLVTESCGGARNLFEASVQVIFENAPVSSDESFRTAENFNSNRNSPSLSDQAMSRDSLEEICDISEIVSLEKSTNIPFKTNCDVNIVSPTEKITDSDSFIENIVGSDVKRTAPELCATSEIRFSNTESERTSSIANSCYFYNSFCIDDSVYNPLNPEVHGKHSSEFDREDISCKVVDTDSNDLNQGNFKFVSDIADKHIDIVDKCISIPLTAEIANISLPAECNRTRDSNYLKIETETAENNFLTTMLPSCNGFDKNARKSQKTENINPITDEDLELPPKIEGLTFDYASTKEDVQDSAANCSDENVSKNICLNTQSSHDCDGDECQNQVAKIGLNSSQHFSQKLLADESSQNILEISQNSVSSLHEKLGKNLSTCSTISPLDKLAEHNITPTKSACKNKSVQNCPLFLKQGSDEMNLKLHIELAIDKNCGVNILSVSSPNREILSTVNKPAVKGCLLTFDTNRAESSSLNNKSNQVTNVYGKNETDAVEKIMSEAHKKIPTLPKVSEHENCDNSMNDHSNKQKKRTSLSKKCRDEAEIKFGLCDAQLLEALDLMDSSFNFNGEGIIQSRDSIMPLNLCIRDKSPKKGFTAFLASKENIPCVSESPDYIQKTDSKGTVIHSKNKQFSMNREIKKPGGKQFLTTKIPIRKADSPLSLPLNQKLVKQDVKITPLGEKHMKPPLVKSASIDSIGKTSSDEMSKKHHFCSVRNSICRVPKSMEKPNPKKFQNVQSPVAKYIGNSKVYSPLKTTHRYDGNFISPLPVRTTLKAANNAYVVTSEMPATKKVGKKLKS